MFVAAQDVLNRPDATLTLAVLAVSAVSLTMLLVHALLRRRAEKRIMSYSRRPAAPVQHAMTAVPLSPARRTVDLTAVEGAATELDPMVGGGSRH